MIDTDAMHSRLVEELRKLGNTMVEIADKIGCAPTVVRSWMVEQRIPGGYLLARLHECGCDILYILTGERLAKSLVCPRCGSAEFTVCDSRQKPDHVYRRRLCMRCGQRFGSVEIGIDDYHHMLKEVEITRQLRLFLDTLDTSGTKKSLGQ